MTNHRIKRERGKDAEKEHKRHPNRETFQKFFELLVTVIATHPWKVCMITFVFNGLLGLGMLNFRTSNLLNNDIEDLYVPKGGPTEKTAEYLLKLFPDMSGYDFYPHQNVKQPLFAEVMIWKHDLQNIINGSIYAEIDHIITYIKNISTFTTNGGFAKYLDVCARRNDECVVEGEEIVTQIKDNWAGQIPLGNLFSKDGKHFESSLVNIADYKIENETLTHAVYLKVRFNLRQDTDTLLKDSKLWRDHFVTYMKKYVSKQYPENLHLTFAHSGSFYEELGNDTFLDIPYFSFVFTIFLTYLGIVVAGGNIIAKRMHIGRIGILVTPISVLGAWGLLMGCGIEFTNTIGVTPLFIQCHQIINALITFSHLSDVYDIKDAKKRLAYAVKSSAIPVTITTFSHLIPFAVGITSNFYVMKLVYIYFVVTMIFNYFNHFVFFTACLALHEHRIDAELHFCTWRKLKPRSQLVDEGRNCCVICCCSGSRPETREDTESGPERITRKLMSRFILTNPVKIISFISYLVYLFFVVWGLILYDIDSVQMNKVLPGSYFSNWNKYFAKEFPNESTIQFIYICPYGDILNRSFMTDFENKIKAKSFLNPETFHSWYEAYSSTVYINLTSHESFLKLIETKFISNNPVFQNDIILNEFPKRLVASRFFINTNHIFSTKAMMKIKGDLYEMTEDVNEYIEAIIEEKEDNGIYDSPAGIPAEDEKYVIAHSPDFLHTDWYMLPLWEILKITSIQFAVMFCAFLIANPSLVAAIHLPFCYFSFVGGIFGISHFLGVYMTPVSMIVYMICSCYGVEVIVHTYSSFMEVMGVNKAGRMNSVLSTISQCLFHTIFGQFLGLLVLIVDESYVFVTVCQLTIITTASCVIHTVLWLPTFLTMVGPGEDKIPHESIDMFKIDLTTVSKGNINGKYSNWATNSAFENSNM